MLTGACRYFTIQQTDFRLRFHKSNVSMYRWIAPGEQNAELEFFRAYLKQGDTVIDVGANIGETVLAESLAVGSSGRVIAFEPHPKTFGFLLQNLELNQVRNVEAHNIGIGEKPKTVLFSNDKRDDMNRVNGDSCRLEVQIETLDDAVTYDDRVQLLKVDVEGYEKFVFAGARALLQRTECIYFEVSTTHFKWFGYTIGEVLDLLANAGFQCFRIIGQSSLESIPPDFETEDFENVVALRDLETFSDRSGWHIAL